MQRYIGTKLLDATPMRLGEYNEYRGWTIPENEDPNKPGYLVEYFDGGESNDDRHTGYISWSPADVFERNYGPTTSMAFGHALVALKQGFKVARRGWNGANMFLFLVPGSNFKVNREPLLGIYPEGTDIEYQSHIDMRTAGGSIVPWLASQSDMLAEDWFILE